MSGTELFGRSAGSGFVGGRWRGGGAGSGGGFPGERVVCLQGADPSPRKRGGGGEHETGASAAQADTGSA